MDREIINKFKLIIDDKGYDSEESHVVIKRYGLLTIISVRNKDIPIHRTRGENRKRMKRHLPEEYGRRPIVETVHLILKRKSNSFVRTRTPKLVKERKTEVPSQGTQI